MNVILLLGLMMMVISSGQAADISRMTAKELGDFAADLELNKALIQHLEKEDPGYGLGVVLENLREALESFEEVFYRREVMREFCDDPMKMEKASDILSAAYRKDLVNPFAEGYNLKLLPLEEVDARLMGAGTVGELKRLDKYEEVIEMVKEGRIHFKSEFGHGYVYSVKAHVRKIITSKMEAAFIKKFSQQTGSQISNLGEIERGYLIAPKMGMIGSYLTMSMAKKIFINLPFIKFSRKPGV